MKHYKLVDKEVVECGLMEWAEMFEKADRTIAKTVTCTDLGEVSTVFLGLDHSFMGGPPLVFETMIFGGPHDQYQTRCSTYEQALQMHEKAVRVLRGEEDDEAL